MAKEKPIETELTRLVLVTPMGDDKDTVVSLAKAALDGGDIASLIIAQHDFSDEQFIALAEELVPLAQEKNVAALIYGDSRAVGHRRPPPY